jgi:hypothetical protein
VTQICHEARAEARHQAQKAGHLITLPIGTGDASVLSDEFYFRSGKDILYIPRESLQRFQDTLLDTPDTRVDTSVLHHLAKGHNNGHNRKIFRVIAMELTLTTIWTYTNSEVLASKLNHFKGLKNIIFVLHDFLTYPEDGKMIAVWNVRRIFDLLHDWRHDRNKSGRKTIVSIGIRRGARLVLLDNKEWIEYDPGSSVGMGSMVDR